MTKHAGWVFVATLCGLAACSQPDAQSPQPVVAALDVAATGARIYSGTCVSCHQPDARGIPGVYPSLVGSPVLLGDPGALARWVFKGERPASMPPRRIVAVMPRFGWLKATDGAALFTYLRSHFGNSAPAVDAATVAAAVSQ